MSRSWYVLIGSDPTNVLSYYKLNVKHGCLCGDHICVIYASNGVDLHPQEPFSSNLLTYISNALSTGRLQPDTPWNAKKYVYLKN